MTLLDGSSAAAVAQAAQHLAAGELVAFATETVYGLGARADDDQAVARIYAAKGRPAGHPLIVHLADPAAAGHFAQDLPATAQRLMAAYWPGPVTVIVPRRAGVAAAAAGGQASIGLRMPAHPQALALLSAAAARGVPGVAAPSANRFGRVSATTAAHVLQEFGPALWVLDGGPCAVGIESAIVDCTRPQPALLRPGALPRLQLESVLGMPLAAADAQSPRAPGTLASHYAPRAVVRLLSEAQIRQGLLAQVPPAQAGPDGGGDAMMLGVYSRVVWPARHGVRLRKMPEDPATVAHELFAVLRDLDDAGVGSIWVEQPPPGADWDGVRDRLQRAAA